MKGGVVNKRYLSYTVYKTKEFDTVDVFPSPNKTNQ